MQSNEMIFEELREIGKNLRLQKYLDTENLLMGTINTVEEKLVKTMTCEQIEIYKHLDGYIWDYVALAEKEAFYHGFQMAKALINNK